MCLDWCQLDSLISVYKTSKVIRHPKLFNSQKTILFESQTHFSSRRVSDKQILQRTARHFLYITVMFMHLISSIWFTNTHTQCIPLSDISWRFRTVLCAVISSAKRCYHDIIFLEKDRNSKEAFSKYYSLMAFLLPSFLSNPSVIGHFWLWNEEIRSD